jgi:hypothetical protein
MSGGGFWFFVQVRQVGEGNRNLKKTWFLAGVRLAAPLRMAWQQVPAAPPTLERESWAASTPSAFFRLAQACRATRDGTTK